MSRPNRISLQESIAEAPGDVQGIDRTESRAHEAIGRPKTAMSDTRLFVALDDSAASARAIKYLASFVCRRGRFHIHLVHVLPPLPARLLEHGGAENPAEEVRLEADLRDQQRDWISGAKKSSRRGLKEAKATLRQAGVPEGSIKVAFCDPGEGRDAADSILNMARECDCRTIIVGRESVSWFHELFSQQLAEELLRRGKGFSIWVIE